MHLLHDGLPYAWIKTPGSVVENEFLHIRHVMMIDVRRHRNNRFQSVLLP